MAVQTWKEVTYFLSGGKKEKVVDLRPELAKTPDERRQERLKKALGR